MTLFLQICFALHLFVAENAMKGRQRQAKAVMRLVSSFSLDARSAKSTASFGTCRARAARHDAQCALHTYHCYHPLPMLQ